jgi:hypothetical protein
MLGAHLEFNNKPYAGDNHDQYNAYINWLEKSFKKCVVRVNQREFDKIAALPDVYLGHENTTLEGRKACAVVCPRLETPNVLKFAKLWKPKHELSI